jgi:hypothetical protein
MASGKQLFRLMKSDYAIHDKIGLAPASLARSPSCKSAHVCRAMMLMLSANV